MRVRLCRTILKVGIIGFETMTQDIYIYNRMKMILLLYRVSIFESRTEAYSRRGLEVNGVR